MEKQYFLALCDQHNSIIHQYGCDISCQKAASVCLRGCSQYEHKQKSSKHQFIPARQIYATVSHLRHHYKTFQSNFKEVYLKRYIQQLKEAVQEFEKKIMKEFCDQHPLPQLFLRDSQENLLHLLDEKVQDIEFSELKCKDIHQLKQFCYHLQKQSKKEEEKRIIKIMTKLFEQHLKRLKLVNNAASARAKIISKSEVFEGTGYQVIDRMGEVLEKLIGKEKTKIGKLIFKIKDKFSQKDQENPSLGKFNQLSKKLVELFNPNQIILAYHGNLTPSPFWDKFMQASSRQDLYAIRILATQPPTTQQDGAAIQQFLGKMRQKYHESEAKMGVLFKKNWQHQPQLF